MHRCISRWHACLLQQALLHPYIDMVLHVQHSQQCLSIGRIPGVFAGARRVDYQQKHHE